MAVAMTTAISPATPLASPPPQPSIFSNQSFLIHHLVNWDDRHLLTHTMASDFSAAWQFSQREEVVISYGSISTPNLVTDQIPQIYSQKHFREGRKSFMSGHSSFSFYCATFLIIYFQERIKS
jgi:membrane-associated phospholipid phosphatase